MNRRIIIGILLTCVLIVTGVLIIANGISQGDTIYTPRGSCTLSYVDNSERKAYTAAHCFDGLHGDEVLDRYGRVIGTHTAGVKVNQRDPARRVTDNSYITDTAEITLRPWVYGNNPYSGSTVISWRSVKNGDTVCYIGAITGEACGVVITASNHRVELISYQGTSKGDSGGAAWVKDRGYLGVITGGDDEAGVVIIDAVHNSENVFFDD